MRYSVEWMTAAWRLSSQNYALAFVLICMMGVIAVIVQRIPLAGGLISSPLFIIIQAGVLTIARKWLNKSEAKFSDVFIFFNDADLMKRLLPYIIVNLFLSLPTIYVNHVVKTTNSFGPLYWIVTLGTMAIGLLFAFTLPQIVFQKRSFAATIQPNIEAVKKNFLTMVVGGVLVVLFACLSLALLILPFIFITMPSFVSLHFLMYATIFEGLELPQGVPKTVSN